MTHGSEQQTQADGFNDATYMVQVGSSTCTARHEEGCACGQVEGHHLSMRGGHSVGFADSQDGTPAGRADTWPLLLTSFVHIACTETNTTPRYWIDLLLVVIVDGDPLGSGPGLSEPALHYFAESYVGPGTPKQAEVEGVPPRTDHLQPGLSADRASARNQPENKGKWTSL